MEAGRWDKIQILLEDFESIRFRVTSCRWFCKILSPSVLTFLTSLVLGSDVQRWLDDDLLVVENTNGSCKQSKACKEQLRYKTICVYTKRYLLAGRRVSPDKQQTHSAERQSQLYASSGGFYISAAQLGDSKLTNHSHWDRFEWKKNESLVAGASRAQRFVTLVVTQDCIEEIWVGSEPMNGTAMSNIAISLTLKIRLEAFIECLGLKLSFVKAAWSFLWLSSWSSLEAVFLKRLSRSLHQSFLKAHQKVQPILLRNLYCKFSNNRFINQNEIKMFTEAICVWISARN